MKTIFIILIMILAFLFLARTEIQFNPFKVMLKEPYYAIGFFLVVFGLALIKFQGERNGAEKIKKEIQEIVNIIK